MTRADYFREKAKEAEQKAEEAKDSDVKERFLELARQWRTMADQSERNPI